MIQVVHVVSRNLFGGHPVVLQWILKDQVDKRYEGCHLSS